MNPYVDLLEKNATKVTFCTISVRWSLMITRNQSVFICICLITAQNLPHLWDNLNFISIWTKINKYNKEIQDRLLSLYFKILMFSAKVIFCFDVCNKTFNKSSNKTFTQDRFSYSLKNSVGMPFWSILLLLLINSTSTFLSLSNEFFHNIL